MRYDSPSVVSLASFLISQQGYIVHSYVSMYMLIATSQRGLLLFRVEELIL
jgi:hypothetical protein